MVAHTVHMKRTLFIMSFMFIESAVEYNFFQRCLDESDIIQHIFPHEDFMLATYSRRLEELFCILDTGIIVQIYYACITISIKRGGMLKTWISNIYCNILSRLESRRYFTILNIWKRRRRKSLGSPYSKALKRKASSGHKPCEGIQPIGGGGRKHTWSRIYWTEKRISQAQRLESKSWSDLCP